MKKHELLKKAYDNYPKGTKFNYFLDPGNFTSSGRFELNENDFNSINDVETGRYGYGKWAEILENKKEHGTEVKPKEIEVKLFGNKTAKVYKDEIQVVIDDLETFYLKPSDIEDIYNAIKQLS